MSKGKNRRKRRSKQIDTKLMRHLKPGKRGTFLRYNLSGVARSLFRRNSKALGDHE